MPQHFGLSAIEQREQKESNEKIGNRAGWVLTAIILAVAVGVPLLAYMFTR